MQSPLFFPGARPTATALPKRRLARRGAIAAAVLAALAPAAHADAVTDWNVKAGEIVAEAKIGTPPAVRLMAVVQTAVHEAVEAALRRPVGTRPASEAAQAAAVDAAVAAAHRATLNKLLPAQQAGTDSAYQAALARIGDEVAKARGVATGEAAAAAVLAQRADDGAAAPESYRPHTTPGVYVPTALPAVPQWQQRKPWLMASPAQFRPAPPPALASQAWARDYDEARLYGARASGKRTAEQTEAARFWDYSLPAIYHGVVRSVAQAPGRDVLRNARLFAAVAQAMDDSMIAVFDAKYHYNFWRPTTAIRNGDLDPNAATEREAAWLPLIDVPMHPEYPSGHSILAGAVAAVIDAEVGRQPMPVLETTSPTAKGATRRWTNTADFVREVSLARIHAGLHFRSATDAGERMGERIGELAAARVLRAPMGMAVAPALPVRLVTAPAGEGTATR
jgi:hypothetical protein